MYLGNSYVLLKIEEGEKSPLTKEKAETGRA